MKEYRNHTAGYFRERWAAHKRAVAMQAGAPVPAIADVRGAILARGQHFGHNQSLVHLEKAMRERLGLPAWRPAPDLEKDSTPEERRNALAFGSLCGRAYVRRWGRYYGLFNKYA